uniref:Protein tramtrack, alpha isoform n=1 Tax=Cacopsylla melanoneura TaxID=428564 RepID=A0A8D8LE48_9HEMI
MSGNKMPEQYSLKWNNFHANLTTGFHGLFEDEDLVDVSLAVEGKIIQAHKVILSVCSPYFKSLFRIHPEKHPIVFLKDVGYSEVIGLLQFMYQGQVDVSQEQLAEFLRVAEMLQVKGLTSNTESEPANNCPITELDPMIPMPVLSTLSNKVNNISSSNNNNNNTSSSSPSQNNALKRKKPPTVSSTPIENCEPIFKIVSVESLKKPKLITADDIPLPGSLNGISEQDPIRDSPSPQAELVLPTIVPMIPKIEPLDQDDYNETNFTDYSDIGENFMSHFMEEPSSDVTPPRSQPSYSSDSAPQPKQSSNSQQKSSSNSSSGGGGNSASSAPSEGSPTNKLTSQQIMNIDVSLLQEQGSPTSIPNDLSRFEIAQVISKKLFYRGFYYRREKMTYNKKLMWKCISYSKFKCHSRIHTYDGRIIFNSDKHNHLPHALEKDQSVFHSSASQANQKTVYRDGHDFMGRSYVSETDLTPNSSAPGVGEGLNRKRRTSGEGKNATPKLSLTKNICFNLQNITKPLQKLSVEQNIPTPLLNQGVGKPIIDPANGGECDVSAMAVKENNPKGKVGSSSVNSSSEQIHGPTDALEEFKKKIDRTKTPLDMKVSTSKDTLSSSNNLCDKFSDILPCNTTSVDVTSHVFSDTITEVPNSLGKLTKCAVKQELVSCTPEIC